MRLAALPASFRYAVTSRSRCQPLSQLGPLLSSQKFGTLDGRTASFDEARRTAAFQGLGIPLLHSKPNTKAKQIAVLGGGLTGLCTAYQLARNIPHAHVTVFEKTNRLGGWLDSEIVEVDGGEVLFEWGPRSLRPDPDVAGLATLSLLASLRLAHEYIGLPKKSVAALNRFIYYPDHLTRMPSPYQGPIDAFFSLAKGILTEPIFSGVLRSTLRELRVEPRSPALLDESVGDFIKRRFGPAIADNLVSALFHGIYAGDIYSMSARTCLPRLWYLETRDPDGNGVMAEQADLILRGHQLLSFEDFRFRFLMVHLKDLTQAEHYERAELTNWGSASAVSTFASGVGVIATRLREVLAQYPKVTIKMSAEVSSLRFDRGKNLATVRTSPDRKPSAYNYVVSTLRPGVMAKLITEDGKEQDSNASFTPVDKATTVMVVNLYYASPDLLPPAYAGFGYLIPRSVDVAKNPERALGVIFGSHFSRRAGSYTRAGYSRPSEDALSELSEAAVKNKYLRERLEHLAARNDDDDDTVREIRLLKKESDRLEQQVEQLSKRLSSGDANEPARKNVRIDQDTAPGTKLGVMIGGHWWNDWAESDYPDEQEAIRMAKSVLQRHLGITEEPLVAKARLQRDCIPQYSVGYREYMAKIHKEVLLEQFNGRLKVAGPWWQGAVGVNDCIRKARQVSLAIEQKWDDQTGLEDFAKTEKWVLRDKRTSEFWIDPMCEESASPRFTRL